MVGDEDENADGAQRQQRDAMEHQAQALARTIRETHDLNRASVNTAPSTRPGSSGNPAVPTTPARSKGTANRTAVPGGSSDARRDPGGRSNSINSSRAPAKERSSRTNKNAAKPGDESVISISGGASNAGSDDETVQRPKRKKRKTTYAIPKKLRTSEILDQAEWPVGYHQWDAARGEWDTSRLDALTPEAAISIRNLQLNREKEEKEFLPGRSGGSKDHPIKPVTFPEALDDCRTELHEARFLRQCLLHPEIWYNKVPIQRKEIVRNIKLKIFGCDQQVAYSTIAALHHRGRKGIKITHFLPRNHNVEVCKLNYV